MILVTGANGYTGVHVIQRLCEEGRTVRALVRRGCAEEEKAFLAEMGAEVITADIEESGALARALEGVRTVVHLLGSIDRPRDIGYRGMHTEKTRLLLKAFRGALKASQDPHATPQGIRNGRIVYLSVLGASPAAGNPYQRTKWEAEEQIRRSGLHYVIIRSSLIFGRHTGSRDSKVMRKLVALARSGRAVPVLGKGNNRVQPIYITDLVTCIETAVDMEKETAAVWQVGGPDIVSLRELCVIIMKTLGVQKRIVCVPYPLAFIMGAVARIIHREQKINFVQVKMSRYDNVCSSNRAADFLGTRMTGLESGLKRTLERSGTPATSGGTP